MRQLGYGNIAKVKYTSKNIEDQQSRLVFLVFVMKLFPFAVQDARSTVQSQSAWRLHLDSSNSGAPGSNRAKAQLPFKLMEFSGSIYC